MANWNIIVKGFFCSLLAFYLAQPSASYRIECLSVDLDCGDLQTTLASICRVYNAFINPGPPYISRQGRSVSNFTEYPMNSSSAFFHPRATHLTKAQADNGTQKALEMPREIQDLSLSPEEANTMLPSNRRLRREVVRMTLREECCSTKFCTYQEVVEYCEDVHPGVNTCSST